MASVKILILRENVKKVPVEGHPSVFRIADSRIYIDVSTPQKMESAALAILTKRFTDPKSGYSCQPPTPPTPCAISKQMLDSMEEGDEKDEAQGVYDRATEENREYSNAMRSYTALRRCIENKDGRLAVAILEERRTMPNEGYEFDFVRESY